MYRNQKSSSISILARSLSASVMALGALFFNSAFGQEPSSVAIEPLPKGVASFGATAIGDATYVYSGHTGRTHEYSKEHMLLGFYRVSSSKGGAWESLPMRSPAQGVALISDAQNVYRIGGMQARNEPGKDHDLYSLRDAAAFDPSSNTWKDLPELPEARSSHRAAVLGRKIYVFGGWNIEGGEEGDWLKHGLVLDLDNLGSGWKTIPQSALRRAAEVLAFQGKVWLIGGLTADGDISDETHVYDPVSESWSLGPAVPGISANGNGIAGCITQNTICIAGMDGGFYLLDENQKGWHEAGKMPSARIHHRLVSPVDGKVIVIGGASRAGHLATAEIVELARK